MSDSHFHVDALRNYLTGKEWRDTIRFFIAANCPFFSNIDDLHPQQAIIWRSFQEVAENVIQTMLADIGGGMDDLERAFEEILHTPSRGPKDEAIKDVLKQLESVDDFTSFAQGMHRACLELFHESGKDLSNNMHDAIMRMGFAVDEINFAMKTIGEEGTLEEALMLLTTKLSEAESSESAYLSPRYHNESKYDDVPISTKNSKAAQYNSAIDKFIGEAAAQNIELDASELNALFVIAESVLEAQREATFSPEMTVDVSETTENLVKWAADMKYLAQDLETAYEDNIPGNDLTFHDEQGLLHFYLTLEERRQQLNAQMDASSMYFNMVSDAELRRMAVLDEIAATGNEDEQRLHRFLSRHEEVRKEIVNLYRKCAIYLHTHPEIKQEQVHHMYLLLKDQLTVGEQQNGYEMEEDIFMTLATTPEQQQVVNILLDIHIREDEQGMLKREIHKLLGIALGGEMDDKNNGLDPSQDKSSLRFDEKGNPIDHDARDAKNGDANGAGGSTEDGFHAMMLLANSTPSEDKDTMEDAKGESAVTGHGNNKSPKKMLLENSPKYDQEEELVDALKQRHRQALQQLKNILENDKQTKLHRLEARLALLRERQHHSHNGSNSNENPDELLEEIRSAEDKKKALVDDSESLRESMVTGFKQRCLAELRTVRDVVAHNAPSPAVSAEDIQSKLNDILMQAKAVHNNTDDSNHFFEDQAKNVLLKQYEQETTNLLQRLQHQRKLQHDALQQRLKNHSKAGTNNSSNNANNAGEEMVLEALRKSEENAMLAIAAAMHLPPTHLLAEGLVGEEVSKSSKAKKDHKDDDYLNDDDENDNQETRQAKARKEQQMLEWMTHMQRLQRQYGHAGEHLRNNLLQQISSSNENDEEAQLLALADAEQVLLQAFTQHMKQESTAHSSASGSSSVGSDKAMQADVKAHILEAFEVAKQQHQQALAYGKDSSQNRLRQRLAGKQGHTNNSSAADSNDGIEAVLTQAIDAFVADAPMIQKEAKDTYRSRDGPIEVEDMVQQTQRQMLLKEKERIKQEHSRNESELVDSLQAAMEQKKRNLEERLRNKKLQQIDRSPKEISVASTGIDPNAPEDHNTNADQETRQVQVQINTWDAAFHRVKNMVETTQTSLTPAQMSDLLDKCFREMMSMNNGNAENTDSKQASIDNSSNYQEQKIGDSTIPRSSKTTTPVKAEAKEDLSSSPYKKPPKSSDNNSNNNSNSHQKEAPMSLHSAADELFGSGANSEINSRRNSHGLIDYNASGNNHGQQRDVLHSEAHRITAEFTQEQQRHDLMMKIQQARQRQSLQRKLWERNQQKQQSQTPTPLSQVQENDELIGAKKPWLQDAYAAKQAAETVKGLVMPMNLQMRADPKAMSMRGMNLGPLMRK